MKTILAKLYFILMGPLYRRLSRDSALHMQEFERRQLEFQERFTSTVCDQMIKMSLERSHSFDHVEPMQLTEGEIIEIVSQINKAEDVVLISKKLSRPLKQVVEVYARYGGMNELAIRTLRQMEERHKSLANSVVAIAADFQPVTCTDAPRSATSAKQPVSPEARL